MPRPPITDAELLRELLRDNENYRCQVVETEAEARRLRAEIVAHKETESILRFQLEMLTQCVDEYRLAKQSKQ